MHSYTPHRRSSVRGISIPPLHIPNYIPTPSPCHGTKIHALAIYYSIRTKVRFDAAALGPVFTNNPTLFTCPHSSSINKGLPTHLSIASPPIPTHRPPQATSSPTHTRYSITAAELSAFTNSMLTHYLCQIQLSPSPCTEKAVIGRLTN